MKRPIVSVTVMKWTPEDSRDNPLVHSETKSAFNSGIRASEKAVGDIARAERVTYEGERPRRAGDIYTRLWRSTDGRVLYVTVAKIGSTTEDFGAKTGVMRAISRFGAARR